MLEPVVSVLMAVHNAEEWLDEALDSLLCNQTLQALEVLAVDDASTDTSYAILQHRAAQDKRLRVFQCQHNSGQAVARNLALQHAKGEYVTMVDADDWLSHDALASAVEVFRQHPQTDCVVFQLEYTGQETGRARNVFADGCDMLTGEEAFRLSLDWSLHGLYIVRREIHLRYPFDDTLPLYSDDNCTHLHYLHSREVRPCAGIYYYRKHGRNSTSVISPNRFFHAEANLLLRKQLVDEGVPHDILDFYDAYRWKVYRGQVWLFFTHRCELTKADRNRVVNGFRRLYPSFVRTMPWPLYFVSEWLRWLLKRGF
ncbi:MAG: glycosyltransferase family 2 protein [Bacteroidaceae bacterium]|nr:glycosyltransferase family 2 protein [Bacteroidaceae bacterium]